MAVYLTVPLWRASACARSDLKVSLKKLGKKDPTTKLKALQQLLVLVDGRDSAVLLVRAVRGCYCLGRRFPGHSMTCVCVCARARLCVCALARVSVGL